MKKITLAVVAVFAAVLGGPAPAIFSAPAEMPVSAKKEKWDELFKDGLFNADGEKTSLADLKKKKYVGIYCSASWCGPCVRFTPKLIEFYNANSSKIEIVLLGADQTQEKTFKYMKDHKMPWLAMSKDSPQAREYLSRHGIRGIPNFMVFDKSGKLVVGSGTDLGAVRKAIGGK